MPAAAPVGGAVEDLTALSQDEAAPAIRAKEVRDATQLLHAEALRTRDDVSLRFLRKRIAKEDRVEKEAATDAGMLLRKRVQEQRDEDSKRAKQALEEKLEWEQKNL